LSIYSFEGKKYEVSLGYDDGFQGCWLIIHHEISASTEECYDEEGEDKYVFHNMNNWPSVRMTPEEVRSVLELYGERVPCHIYQEIKESYDLDRWPYLEYKYFSGGDTGKKALILLSLMLNLFLCYKLLV